MRCLISLLFLITVQVGAYYEILLTLDHPYSFGGEYLMGNRGEFTDDEPSNESLRYGNWIAAAGYTFCLGDCSGLMLAGRYSDLTMDWKNSPYFNEDHFPMWQVSFTAFTCCLYRWLWKLHFAPSFQTTEFSFGRYALYTGALWGRYDYGPDFGIHLGVMAIVGLRKGFVRPIAGFDWHINDRICLRAVYPIDIDLMYAIIPQVQIGAGARLVRERRRLDDDQPISQGIFEYRGWGGEGRLAVCPFPGITVDLYAGSLFSAWIKMRDSENERLDYRTLRANFYAGGKAAVYF